MIKIRFNGSNRFYDASFSRNSANVVTLKGEMPISKKGFLTYRMDEETQLGDFSDYKTVYREISDGVQYSNDGSVYVDPPIVVSVAWNDENDREGVRPNEVNAKVTIDGAEEIITLNDDNNWSKEYENIGAISVEFDAVKMYSVDTRGTTATYTHECIPEPTLEQRVSDLEEAVCELADIL